MTRPVWLRILVLLTSVLIILNVVPVHYPTVSITRQYIETSKLNPLPSLSVTSTSLNLSINDVLLVVRTSSGTKHRLPSILKTWFLFSPNTTYITSNSNIEQLVPPHYHRQIYQTECRQGHSITDLCCQSASQFHVFFAHEREFQWLCRFDDDQYVNVPRLIDYLRQFQPDIQPLYIGKPSLNRPVDRGRLEYWFASYGGGVCFSRFLLRMIRAEIEPKDRFTLGCVQARRPDDVYTAHLLKANFSVDLTVAKDFHHHIEGDLFSKQLRASNIDQAITLGFRESIVPPFVPIFERDTFRIQTLHCLLYPNDDCMRRLRLFSSQVNAQQKEPKGTAFDQTQINP